MNMHTFIWTCFIITIIYLNGNECNELNNNLTIKKSTQFFIRNGIYKMKELWRKLEIMGKNENTFVGRCLGVARKLKFVLPLIVFKLGVIITTLVFLTLFSMKSIGIGLLLLLISISQAVGKLVLLFRPQQEKSEKVVNYHVYKNHPSGGEHDDIVYSGWNDKSDTISSSPLTLAQRLQLQNYHQLGFTDNLDYT